MITRIGSTIGSSVEGAIPSVAVALNRPTSSFVMYALSAQGRGGMSSTAIRCWRFAVPSITARSIECSSGIDSGYERHKNDRMLLWTCDITASKPCVATPPLVALDDLGDEDMAPGAQPGPSAL